MRILFASYNHLPKIGGITITTDQLARRLVKRNHAVAVLTRLEHRSAAGRYQRLRQKVTGRPSVAVDKSREYTVFRAIDPARSFPCVQQRFRPDVIVVNVGGSMEDFAVSIFRAAGSVPTALYIHDAACIPLLRRDDVQPKVALGAGDHLTDAIAREFALPATTITPLIEGSDYGSQSTRRVVLFINPTPIKGVDTAWALAKSRPDIPFVFLESWPLRREKIRDLRRRARSLGNVAIRRAQHDQRCIYADARVLLAPYGATEGFGRVVVEAQALGIPTLTSDVPTFRSIVGPGGILVDPNAPTTAWAAALAALWDDEAAYERFAAAARHHAGRQELKPDYIVSRFEAAVSIGLSESD